MRVRMPAIRTTRGPEWIQWAANCRDAFRSMAIRLEWPRKTEHFKFTFAKQRPCVLAMTRLEVAMDVEPILDGPDWHERDLVVWEHSFVLMFADVRCSDTGDFDGATPSFLPDVFMGPSGFLSSDADWMSLAEAKRALPCEQGARVDRRNGEVDAVPGAVAPEPWMEEMFMWDYLANGDTGGDDSTLGPRRGSRKKDNSDDESSSSDISEGSWVDEFDAMALLGASVWTWRLRWTRARTTSGGRCAEANGP
ncbi:unnamed protein product [Prorocentrum cordatum]|uniref:Uncharacterized protein n=1 Tax=Prorocentrum cordatum TaxID=2364126 RepID=A0ABN9U8P7_9DINO|nr:unnamed protein product [Polarella glacialis]